MGVDGGGSEGKIYPENGGKQISFSKQKNLCLSKELPVVVFP